MKAAKKIPVEVTLSLQNNRCLFDKIWDESWVYVRTVVDVKKQPALVLDKNFTILAVNESFYHFFQTDKESTVSKKLFEISNGQWDIPAIKTHLGNILTTSSFFKGFEVNYKFPKIGEKVLMLSARQIYYQEKPATKDYLPLILLTLEDVTEMMSVADSLAKHMNQRHHLDTLF